MGKEKIKKFAFEFLSIFIGVFAAFALGKWNENRKDKNTEIKILTEINTGLKQDLSDISENELGHKQGLQATIYFRDLVIGKKVDNDSLGNNYFKLFRDFIAVQNLSGYQTLKSKGLETIGNDSLRSEIIALYENDYNSIRKLEENYSELQFQENYFKEFNATLAPNFLFDDKGRLLGINLPVKISENEKKIMLINLWKMRNNRGFILANYSDVKIKINKLQRDIEKELKGS